MQHDTIYAIGEALIDFIPQESGCDFSQVTAFSPALGGAPVNVCGAVAKLGGRSQMITQVGDDPFGHKILREMGEAGIGTAHVFMTQEANTCLAFVSLAADGNRTFSFYRNPSADMLLAPERIHPEWFQDAYALHFCSVSLGDTPMKEAHEKAILYARQSGALISFDPNLRFPLWPDREALYRRVWEFIPQADILKISDEELAFLTGSEEIHEVLPKLWQGNVKMILYTCGSRGAWAFTPRSSVWAGARTVHAVDTTGAGDAFAGAVLYCLQQEGVGETELPLLSSAKLRHYLEFANRYCALSVQKKGAIPSYPTQEDMEGESPFAGR